MTSLFSLAFDFCLSFTSFINYTDCLLAVKDYCLLGFRLFYSIFYVLSDIWF